MALLLTAVTITLSVLPADKINHAPLISIPYADKIGHMIAYLSLGFIWLLVLHTQKKKEFKTLLFLFSMGMLIELTQFYFLVGRYFEILDIIANISGAILGIVLCSVLYRKKLH
jgi:VanZ family protein